jgi:hypothetical protein
LACPKGHSFAAVRFRSNGRPSLVAVQRRTEVLRCPPRCSVLRCRRRFSPLPGSSPSAFLRVLLVRPSVDIIRGCPLPRAETRFVSTVPPVELAPPAWFPTILAAFSTCDLPGLLHPGADHGVHRVALDRFAERSSFPDAIPSRAFPSSPAAPSSPRLRAPLPSSSVRPLHSTSGPCSDEESVAATRRFRRDPPVALLGFPDLEPLRSEDPRPSTSPARAPPKGGSRGSDSWSSIVPCGTPSDLVGPRRARLEPHRPRAIASPASRRPVHHRSRRPVASRRDESRCHATLLRPGDLCVAASVTPIAVVARRPAIRPKASRALPCAATRAHRARCLPRRPAACTCRSYDRVAIVSPTPARFAAPPARPPSCSRTRDAAHHVLAVPSARMAGTWNLRTSSDTLPASREGEFGCTPRASPRNPPFDADNVGLAAFVGPSRRPSGPPEAKLPSSHPVAAREVTAHAVRAAMPA